jgi:hypothetical protein
MGCCPSKEEEKRSGVPGEADPNAAAQARAAGNAIGKGKGKGRGKGRGKGKGKGKGRGNGKGQGQGRGSGGSGAATTVTGKGSRGVVDGRAPAALAPFGDADGDTASTAYEPESTLGSDDSETDGGGGGSAGSSLAGDDDFGTGASGPGGSVAKVRVEELARGHASLIVLSNPPVEVAEGAVRACRLEGDPDETVFLIWDAQQEHVIVLGSNVSCVMEGKGRYVLNQFPSVFGLDIDTWSTSLPRLRTFRDKVFAKHSSFHKMKRRPRRQQDHVLMEGLGRSLLGFSKVWGGISSAATSAIEVFKAPDPGESKTAARDAAVPDKTRVPDGVSRRRGDVVTNDRTITHISRSLATDISSKARAVNAQIQAALAHIRAKGAAKGKGAGGKAAGDPAAPPMTEDDARKQLFNQLDQARTILFDKSFRAKSQVVKRGPKAQGAGGGNARDRGFNNNNNNNNQSESYAGYYDDYGGSDANWGEWAGEEATSIATGFQGVWGAAVDTVSELMTAEDEYVYGEDLSF